MESACLSQSLASHKSVCLPQILALESMAESCINTGGAVRLMPAFPQISRAMGSARVPSHAWARVRLKANF